jgi:hypothetical protein
MERNTWCAVGVLGSLVGCGSMQPEDYLKEDMRKVGFIPYEMPIAEAGTGTLVGGSAKAMIIYGGPQECFPDLIANSPTGIRKVSDIDLPTRASSYRVTGSARVGLVDALGKGNSPVKAGIQFEKAQSIEWSYTKPTREYIDSVKLIPFYKNSMPGNYVDSRTGLPKNACKDILDRVGFIREAIKIDSMSFKFYSSKGGAIDLTVIDPKTLLEFGFGTTWQVLNRYELRVTSPKYIGYRMGQARKVDDGLSLCSATTFGNDGKYDFRCESFESNLVGRSMGFAPSFAPQGRMPKFTRSLDKVVPIQGVYRKK